MRRSPRIGWRFTWIGLATLVAVLAVLPEEARAIPAFARKYQFSCSTCHAPFPRLKPFGEEFAARGFRLADPTQEPTRADYDVGDPLLKLPRNLPLAIRLEGYGSYNQDAQAETDFETPWVFKILSGGPLSDRVSYYLYFIVEKNETESLEDAWVQINDLFGSGVDLQFGQFQISDILFKRELRLERTDYAIYQVRVGNASPNLTYDRGIILLKSLPGGWEAAFEVVNGNGIPKGEFDNDTKKNLALRVGGTWGPVRAGVFGYWGKESPEGLPTNETTYLGPDFSVALGGNWAFNFQYLHREDDNPFFVADPRDKVKTDGGFAELNFFPQGEDGRWALSALYNRVESDDPGAVVEVGSLTLNYLLARNIRVLTEVARDLDGNRTQASLGLVTAF